MALYFENSLLPPDLTLLPSAAATVTRSNASGRSWCSIRAAATGIPWRGGAKVDGIPWPARDDQTLWLPAGPHSVEHAPAESGPRLIHLNGDLKSAHVVDAATIEFTYLSSARAIAILDRTPAALEIDGVATPAPNSSTLMLPRGQHVVSVR